MKNYLLKRKELRIKGYSYSDVGYYFVTICVNNRMKILSNVEFNENTNHAKIELLPKGIIAEQYIKSINQIYNNINVLSYIIMPNHIHMVIEIINNGSSRTPTPTNETIPFIISTFKRLTNKEYKEKIWQRNYYEHIIRNEKEYIEIVEYIQNNPLKWENDKYNSQKL